MMKNLLIRAGLGILGVVATLTWWSFHHDSGAHTQSSDHIPAKVWSGGHNLQVDVETSSAATMRISFSEHDKPVGEQNTLETWEKVSAGSHSWTIDFPAHVGGYIELGADSPNTGDRLSMRISVDGKLADEQIEKLDSPLQPGTAFFVQRFYDDYANPGAEESADEKQ